MGRMPQGGLSPLWLILWKTDPSPYNVHMHRRTLLAGALVVLVAAAPTADVPQARITSPLQEFGHNFGDDYFLANYQQIAAYWRKLDRESDRITVESIGKTAEGREQLMAIVTSPENHRNLERYKDISRRLALADGLDEAGARALAATGQGRRVDRRRAPCHRSARRAATRRDGLPDGEPHRCRDAPDPRRGDHPVRARESGRQRSGGRLVHAQSGSARAIDRRPAAALPAVHRPRQQPRFLRVDADGNREHQPRALPRVVPAGPLQPPPERAGRHDPVVAAASRSVQLQPGPTARARPADGWYCAAHAAGSRRKAWCDDAIRWAV